MQSKDYELDMPNAILDTVDLSKISPKILPLENFDLSTYWI